MVVIVKKSAELSVPLASPVPALPAAKKKKSGHTSPKQPVIDLDQQGRLRVANLLAILNVSHSTFYAGVKSGRYPPADNYDGKIPWWSTTTVRPLVK